MFILNGMEIVVSPLVQKVPKLKLRPDCPVTDEFRGLMDQWLLDTFGTHYPAYAMGNGTVFVSQEMYDKITKVVDRIPPSVV